MASPFTYFSSGFTVDQIPDLTGKVAIVTGGNAGLGYETVLQLAKKGARVFMASRSEERAKEALERLKGESQLGEALSKNVEFLKLDLGDLKQVKAAAQEFLDKKLPLHILVNNAGLGAGAFALTKDGIEAIFGTNHLGHFAFTLPLLPALEQGAPSRVVNVSSYAHVFAPKEGILFDRIKGEAGKMEGTWYAQSKLANILFTRELDKRYGSNGIYVNAVHPGGVQTGIWGCFEENMGWTSGWKAYSVLPLFLGLKRLLLYTPAQGAITQIYVAASPEIQEKGWRGKYFVPQARLEEKLNDLATSDELAGKLWAWSLEAVEEATVAASSPPPSTAAAPPS